MANPYRTLYDFTYRNEVQAGRSNRPHWPGGASGLTLGPGYDIGHRTEAEVLAFLGGELGCAGAGLTCFAAGAGLTGDDAEAYLDSNRALLDALDITTEQEEAIFALIAPKYEDGVKRILARRVSPVSWDDLDDDQKSLLFDYHYNVGLSKFPRFTAAVLARDWAAARAQSVRGGLEGTRRERETFAFLDRLIGSGTRLA
jgi:hypothetical protein